MSSMMSRSAMAPAGTFVPTEIFGMLGNLSLIHI